MEANYKTVFGYQEANPKNIMQILASTPTMMRALGYRDRPVCLTTRHFSHMIHATDPQHPEYHNLSIEECQEFMQVLRAPMAVLTAKNNCKMFVSDMIKDQKVLVLIVADENSSIRADGREYNFVKTGYYMENYLQRWKLHQAQVLYYSAQLENEQFLNLLGKDAVEFLRAPENRHPGFLPPHYNYVVEDGQREDVYQDRYDPQRMDYSNCIFQEVKLAGNLRGRNFSGSIFYKSRLADADLTGANFTGATFMDRTTLDRVDFTDVAMRDAVFEGVKISGCTFSHVDLSRAQVKSCEFTACRFDQARLTEGYLEQTTFYDCDGSLVLTDTTLAYPHKRMEREPQYVETVYKTFAQAETEASVGQLRYREGILQGYLNQANGWKDIQQPPEGQWSISDSSGVYPLSETAMTAANLYLAQISSLPEGLCAERVTVYCGCVQAHLVWQGGEFWEPVEVDDAGEAFVEFPGAAGQPSLRVPLEDLLTGEKIQNALPRWTNGGHPKAEPFPVEEYDTAGVAFNCNHTSHQIFKPRGKPQQVTVFRPTEEMLRWIPLETYLANNVYPRHRLYQQIYRGRIINIKDRFFSPQSYYGNLESEWLRLLGPEDPQYQFAARVMPPKGDHEIGMETGDVFIVEYEGGTQEAYFCNPERDARPLLSRFWDKMPWKMPEVIQVYYAYVKERRAKLNQGDYQIPKLSPTVTQESLEKELSAEQGDPGQMEQVRAEIAQDAKDAGMTVEEYAANGWKPYDKPDGADSREPDDEPDGEDSEDPDDEPDEVDGEPKKQDTPQPAGATVQPKKMNIYDEPVVTILRSTHPDVPEGLRRPLHEMNELFDTLATSPADANDKRVLFQVDCVFEKKRRNCVGIQDFKGGKSLIDCLEIPEAKYHWTQRDVFVSYLNKHCEIGELEAAALSKFGAGKPLSAEETVYYAMVPPYVKECRAKLNQGDYQIPELSPTVTQESLEKELSAEQGEPGQMEQVAQQLASAYGWDGDFMQMLRETQEYKEQVRAEIAQEAEDAGMTVEEYAANGWKPYDKPDGADRKPKKQAAPQPARATVQRRETPAEHTARRNAELRAMREQRTRPIGPGDRIRAEVDTRKTGSKYFLVTGVEKSGELLAVSLVTASRQKTAGPGQIYLPARESGFTCDVLADPTNTWRITKDIPINRCDPPPEASRRQLLNSIEEYRRTHRAAARPGNAPIDVTIRPEESKRWVKEQLLDSIQNWTQDPQKWVEYLKWESQFYQYSARNRALIYRQNPEARFVGGEKMFQKAGYEILPEHKSNFMYIYAPRTVTYFRRNDKPIQVKYASSAEKAAIASGKIRTEDKTYFNLAKVYEIGQTTCPPEKYPQLLGIGKKDERSAALYTDFKRLCHNCGIPVVEERLCAASLDGYYDPEKHEIYINNLLQDSEKLPTLIHEYCHGMLHKTSTAPREIMEFEAESLAAVLLGHFQIAPSAECIGHVKSNMDAAKKLPGFELGESIKRLHRQLTKVEGWFKLDQYADFGPGREQGRLQAYGISAQRHGPEQIPFGQTP